jgi:excinuclease ABC subunit A
VLSLGELRGFVAGLTTGLPAELTRLTTGLLAELQGRLTPLLDVGLGYLTLDRGGASLSTGERQRIELTSTVRASTTGMLYVLDEPSVGLHPSNVEGLLNTITALAGNGNSEVVEHEREVIRNADWVIELGRAAGAKGGTVIAQGLPGELAGDPLSIMGPFLAGAAAVARDRPARPASGRQITMEIGDLYNLHDITAAFPEHRLTALAGPSGAGKTALVLDSLIPAVRALLSGSALPAHVRRLDLAAFARSSRWTLGRSARTRGRHPPPIPGRSTRSAACSPRPRTPGADAGSRGISRSTPGRGSARPAAGSATLTSTSSARPAMVPVSTTPLWLSGSTA